MAEAASLGHVLRQAKRRLSALGDADAGLDARLIVEHFSGTSRTDAIARPLMTLPVETVTAIGAALARRLAGEPVHRILGYREFYGLQLHLSPATLEPRPDTETLVDAIVPFLEQRVSETGSCRILDLGTGTGAVALALLSAVPAATALATDISAEAAETAAANALRLTLAERFHAVVSNWWEKVEGEFDAIASNPPYIASSEIGFLAAGVREFDPLAALDGGSDGLDAYRVIAAGADRHLAPGGRIGVEIGIGQAQAVAAIFAGEGFKGLS
ncbi:MAG: peptide chain release factor N(5)-glutamine methyltransferase, partial [Rhizobiaceae bacterium]|nr:peptide chain release factor N(5)-glutamine methyltransferase [Rhizobiaceae bacterium]